GLDLLFDLALDGLEVEARRRLHWRILDGRLRQLGDRLLDEHEPPEFAAHEIVHVAAARVVEALAAVRRGPLERILANVDDRGHVGRVFLAWPPVRLLEELELEVVVAQRAEMRTSEVEDLVARRRSLTFQESRLVIAVEMVLVGPAFQV